ncbi:hypothetical protein pEaSNUABM47_00083 [Erwinia phage pEa_SNUABM_47]|uniref:Lipoprotein n=1 Tax=Erwinia phage pEa_SNUABM_47 TaxID=2768774 RepID=A0A7L8ZMT0_9CAUD|nr:hypothetical protein pEaSNUABM47_00083 [Erwinia phage pEa_SNUABM_47]
MKKLLAVLVLAFTITGCDGSAEDRTGNYTLPSGLQDCQIYRLAADGIGKTLYVVRCPNSNTSTTFSSGKNNSTTVSNIGG